MNASTDGPPVSVVVIECTIPPGMTIADWRRWRATARPGRHVTGKRRRLLRRARW